MGLAVYALLASGCVVVVTSDCHNGIRDGNETDVDCGGIDCAPCGVGGFCSLNRDCSTGICAAGVCSPGTVGPTCADGVKNGNESDIDCGGSCAKCGGGKACGADPDCAGNVCQGGVCTPHPNGAGAAPTSGQLLGIASGQGATATAPGWAITASGIGASTFRVTALGSNSSDELYGTISSAGTISGVTPGCTSNACPVATIDYIASSSSRIDFDFLAPTSPAGFDFDLAVNSSGTPVYFDLYVNGVRAPQTVVYFDGDINQEASPATMPFGLYAK
jgi:hypothetical protein